MNTKATIQDNLFLPFEIKPLDVRGRVVRLGSVVDEILAKHDYPDAVSALLAEAVSLVALLGTSLKFDGKLILQTRTDGPVSMIVADFMSPDKLRGYAHFDTDKLAKLDDQSDPAHLLGQGHLALTIDQGEDMENYQGIVALKNGSLADAAHEYFRQSEQIPTALKVAAGKLSNKDGTSWRAGAIIVQHMPKSGPASPMQVHSGDAPSGSEEIIVEDDHWVKARYLLETTQDDELLDPMLSPQELLYRLFHEDGATVFKAGTLRHACSCSRDKMLNTLASFGEQDRQDMVLDGKIGVTCQFCSNSYDFDPDEIAQLPSKE